MTTTLCPEVLSVQELQDWNHAPLQCIDVRSAAEFAAGHIPRAVNIPMDELESRLADLRPGEPVLLICQGGSRAAMTRTFLDGHCGNLAVLRGGTDAWRAAGLPLVASTRTRWSLERQVRLGAGLLVLTGLLSGSW